MLDLNLIKNNPDYVSKALKKKGWEVDFKDTIAKMDKRLELIQKVEAVKAEINKLSASVPMIKKEGGDIQAVFAKVKELKAQNEQNENDLNNLEAEIKAFVETLPNLPDDDLLPGEKENNKPIYTFGKKPEFTFKPKDHVELAESLGLIDYERAAKILDAALGFILV